MEIYMGDNFTYIATVERADLSKRLMHVHLNEVACNSEIKRLNLTQEDGYISVDMINLI